MKPVTNLFACCLAAALTASATAQVTSFTDNFEGTTLNPFWTPIISSGSVTLSSTGRVHGGRQSVQLNSVNTAAVKGITLQHRFPQPTYGCASIWVFDTGADVTSSNYLTFYAGQFSISTWDYDLGGTNGGNYVYNLFGQGHDSGIDRTQAWHLFSISATPSSSTIAIDGTTVYTGPEGFPFDVVQFDMHAPSWRPAWVSFWDDFSFIVPTPSTYNLFGAGCRGSNGTPTINAPAATPRLGTNFDITISSLPITSAAFGILGLSNTRMGNGTPLPQPLAAFGMPGCQLLVSDEAILFLGNRPTPTTALWTLPVPMDVHLLGASFFQQVLVTDPGINALGVTGSNAGRGTIGDCQ